MNRQGDDADEVDVAHHRKERTLLELPSRVEAQRSAAPPKKSAKEESLEAPCEEKARRPDVPLKIVTTIVGLPDPVFYCRRLPAVPCISSARVRVPLAWPPRPSGSRHRAI